MYNSFSSSVTSAAEPSSTAYGDHESSAGVGNFPLELASPPMDTAPEITMQYITHMVPTISSTNYFGQTVTANIPCGPRSGAIMGGTLHIEVDVSFEIDNNDKFFPEIDPARPTERINRAIFDEDLLTTHTQLEENLGSSEISALSGDSTISIPATIKRKLPRFACGISESLKATEVTTINQTKIPIGTNNHILQQAQISKLNNDESKTLNNMRFRSKYSSDEYLTLKSYELRNDGRVLIRGTFRIGADPRFFASNVRAFPTCILTYLDYSFTIPTNPAEIFDPRYIVPRAMFIERAQVKYIRLQLGDAVESQLSRATLEPNGAIEFYTYRHQPSIDTNNNGSTTTKSIAIHNLRVKQVDAVIYNRVDYIRSARSVPKQIATALSFFSNGHEDGGAVDDEMLIHWSYSTPSVAAINNILPGFEKGSGVYGCIGDLPQSTVLHVDQQRFNEVDRSWQEGLTHSDAMMRSLGRSVHEIPTPDSLYLTPESSIGKPYQYLTTPNIISYNLEGTKNSTQYFQGYTVNNSIELTQTRNIDSWNTEYSDKYPRYNGRYEMTKAWSKGPIASLKNFMVSHPRLNDHVVDAPEGFSSESLMSTTATESEGPIIPIDPTDPVDDDDIPYIFTLSTTTNDVLILNDRMQQQLGEAYTEFMRHNNDGKYGHSKALEHIKNFLTTMPPHNSPNTANVTPVLTTADQSLWSLLFPNIRGEKRTDYLRKILNGVDLASGSGTAESTSNMECILPCTYYPRWGMELIPGTSGNYPAMMGNDPVISYLFGLPLMSIHQQITKESGKLDKDIEQDQGLKIIGFTEHYRDILRYERNWPTRLLASALPLRRFDFDYTSDDMLRMFAKLPDQSTLPVSGLVYYMTVTDFYAWLDGGGLQDLLSAIQLGKNTEFAPDKLLNGFIFNNESNGDLRFNTLRDTYKLQLDHICSYLYPNEITVFGSGRVGSSGETLVRPGKIVGYNAIDALFALIPNYEYRARRTGSASDRVRVLCEVAMNVTQGFVAEFKNTKKIVKKRFDHLKMIYDYGYHFTRRTESLPNARGLYSYRPAITTGTALIYHRNLANASGLEYWNYFAPVRSLLVDEGDLLQKMTRVFNGAFPDMFDVDTPILGKSALILATETIERIVEYFEMFKKKKPNTSENRMSIYNPYMNDTIQSSHMQNTGMNKSFSMNLRALAGPTSVKTNLPLGTVIDDLIPIDIGVTRTEYLFVTFPVSISWSSEQRSVSLQNF